MDDWKRLDIPKPADRETVALILYRSEYTTREGKRKDGNKTIVFVEYKEK